MNRYLNRAVRGATLASALALPLSATAADDDGAKAIDTITIFGRKADVADVPGSAHKIDSEELAIFNTGDVLRALRTVPGVYLQEEEGFGLRPNIGIRGSGLDRSARIMMAASWLYCTSFSTRKMRSTRRIRITSRYCVPGKNRLR